MGEEIPRDRLPDRGYEEKSIEKLAHPDATNNSKWCTSKNSCIVCGTSINKGTEDLTQEEENALVARAKGGCQNSRMLLLEKYERLRHKHARRLAFAAPSHQHEDLVQEACIGLLTAIDSYEFDKGARFMTWAFYHVRGAVASCARIDRRQPKYPKSIEDADRSHNLEDFSQRYEPKDPVSEEKLKEVISTCCNGLDGLRANIVMDRFGLFGRKELRNFECAAKYGLSKHAINSHTYNFKKKARRLFPELKDLI